MIMSKSHFKTTMTRRTKCSEIVKQIGVILKFVKSSAVNMMNVKHTTAGAAFCSTASARFVAAKNFFTNRLPISAMGQCFATAPMRAILASHVLNSTFTRTILATIFGHRREDIKYLLAINADKCNVRLNTTSVSTLRGTISNLRRFLIEQFATKLAVGIGPLCLTPCSMAFTRAKVMCCFSCLNSVNRPRKLSATIITFEHNVVPTIGTTLRAILHRILVVPNLECLSTSEACFDHNQS